MGDLPSKISLKSGRGEFIWKEKINKPKKKGLKGWSLNFVVNKEPMQKLELLLLPFLGFYAESLRGVFPSLFFFSLSAAVTFIQEEILLGSEILHAALSNQNIAPSKEILKPTLHYDIFGGELNISP